MRSYKTTANNSLTYEQALPKLLRFCAYRERCRQEVIMKLNDLEVSEAIQRKIINFLEKDNFLNEERFAKLYVHGKFVLKQWGRIKIIRGLKEKGISEKHIQKGLKEISEKEYKKALQSLLKSKILTLKKIGDFERKNKAANYAVSKGYEPDLVWSLLGNMVPDS